MIPRDAVILPEGVTFQPIPTILTKREMFAAMALQGILANPDGSMVQWDEERVALAATEHADALIAELEKAK